MIENMVPKEPDKVPLRRCIATGKIQPLHTLIRFVVGPEGVLYPDLFRKLPGRGIWVGGQRNLIDLAVKKRLFARAAKRPVRVPDDMAGMVECRLVESCLSFIGLAKRAGQLTIGSQNVKALLPTDVTAIVITAIDASNNGRSKILSGDQGRLSVSGSPYRKIVHLFSIAELSLALGRENVVHAALLAGGLADQFLKATYRLELYRYNKAFPS